MKHTCTYDYTTYLIQHEGRIKELEADGKDGKADRWERSQCPGLTQKREWSRRENLRL